MERGRSYIRPPWRIARGAALRSVPVLILAAVLAAGAEPLSAQIPAGRGAPAAEVEPVEPRSGTWWAVGLGAGALRFTCDLCAEERDRGPSLLVMLGAYAGPRLRVALEGGGWTRDDDGVREALYRAGVTGFFHPREDSGLHLLAGLGWVGYRADELRYDSGSLSVGLGWDFPILSDWTLGNALRIDAGSFGSFKNDGDRVAAERRTLPCKEPEP